VVEHDVDVVHLHSPALAALARPALRTLRPRPAIVTTEHNSMDCYSWPTRVANIATYPLDDHRFAVSRDAVDSVPRPFRGRSEVLVHGIDLDAVGDLRRSRGAVRSAVRDELGIDHDAPVVVTVANHRAEKAWDVLLPAARRVLEQHPDVVVLGAGHGQLLEANRDLHRRLELGRSVRLLGFRPDALRLLAAAELFVLASRQEGLPVAVMEAMAIGLPIVATAVGGLPAAVEHGRSGLLVPSEDPEALAVAIGSVVADEQLRGRLAAGALADASRFDIRRAVAVLEDRYQRLGQSRSAPAGGR
jgi:glycosyltransferase involved in cell wall biosynthesis